MAMALVGLLAPAAGGPLEAQDPVSEVITSRFVFDGTDGSFYNGTQAGSQGAELGSVLSSISLGAGYWGIGAVLQNVQVHYPGNLTLGPSSAANEVFHARSGAAPRDRDANGTVVWTAAGPSDSVHTLAFDIDGDGFLDDAVLAYTGVANRYYTYNQVGVQQGQRNLPPGGTWINDLAALDSDSNGVLDQIVLGLEAGRVYVERPPAVNVWNVVTPGSAPVRLVAAIDLNNDSFIEGVLAAADDFTVADDESVYAYNATGVLRWSYNTGGVGIVNISAIEPNGSHLLNGALVATNDSVAVLNALGQVVWNWSTNATVTAAAAADFNHDGIVEGAVYADDAGGISFLNSTGGLIAWLQILTAPIYSLAAVDLNADGWVDEVAAANNTSVIGLAADGSFLWNATVGAGYRINMLARADFDGNGTYGDTIVPTTSTLYVYNRTGALRWSAAEARNVRSVAFIENPSAAASGSYLSPELDAGTAVAWTELSSVSAVNSGNEALAPSIRFGDGSPGSVVWNPWSGPLALTPTNLSGNASRFVQVRYDFTSSDGLNAANLSSFRINFTTPAQTGSVVTPAITPSTTPSWLDFVTQGNLSGGQVRSFYSADAGASWHPFVAGEFVDAANASAPSLRFRVEMDLGTTSPNVAYVGVRYAQIGLRPVVASPADNSTITGTANISAVALPSISGVSFSVVNLSTNVTTALGAGAFDGVSGRWWMLWNTSALHGPGFALAATGTDPRGFTFSSARAPFDIDNVAPSVVIQTPAPNAVLSQGVPLRAIASADTASLTFSYFDGVSVVPIGGSTQISPGLWELVWNTSALGEIENARLYADATDGVGLVGSAASIPVVIDNVAPLVNITAPSPGPELTGLVNVTVDASLDVVGVEIFYNGSSQGNASALANTSNASHWIVSWNTAPVYFSTDANLTAVARDRAGHLSSAVAGPYTINNTQPVPDLVAPSNFTFNTGLVYVAATAPLGTASIEFSYQDRGAALPTLIRTMTAAQRNFTSGLWEFTWDTRSPKVDFNGTIILKAVSGFGVSGTRSWGWIVVDNTAPTISFVAPAITETRLSGMYLIGAQTASDVVSADLSYTRTSDGETVPVGPLSSFSPFEWGLTWDLTSVYVPSVTLHLTGVDRVGFRAWANFSFVILGLNPGDDPPAIVRNPSDVFLDEDFGTFTFDLAGLVTDDDVANVTSYIQGVDPSVVTLRNNGSKGLLPIYFMSIQDAHSKVQSQVRLLVIDASGQSASREFGFFVQPRNDAPYWSAPPEVPPPASIFVHYDAPYELDFAAYAHDVEFEHDGGPLFVTADDARVVQNASRTTSLVFNFPQALNGQSFDLTLSLFDDDATLDPVTTVVTVYVTDDWVPELTRPIPLQYLDEDTPKFNLFDLDDYFIDRDNEAIFYYRGNTNLTFDIRNGEVSVTGLPANWSGTQTVFFGANDTRGAFSEGRVTFIVREVNDAPEWDFSSGLDLSTIHVHFDVPFAFDLAPYGRDVDDVGAALRLGSSDPDHAGTAPGRPMLLVLNFPESMNGTTQLVQLWISDGKDNSTIFALSVEVSSNYPPTIVQPLPQELVISEGETRENALDLSQYFVDPDGVLFFTNGTVHVKVTIVGGSLTVASEDEWSGTETLIIRAVDNEGSFQQATVLVTVLAVDDWPRLRAIPDFTIESGKISKSIGLIDYVDDPDTPRDRLVFSAKSTYNGAFLSIVNGSLKLVYPQYEGANTFDPLTVCVSDGNHSSCRIIAVRIIQPTERPFDWLGLIFVMSAAAAGSIVAARHFVEFKIKRAATVEDIFLVYEDGILIKHYSKKMRKFADDDVVTSMLSAIQSFAADSFEDTSNWELREITFQGRKILIEKARKFQIYIIFDGDSNEDLKRAIKRSADAIAWEYRDALKDWDGDPSHFDGAEKHFADLLRMEAAFIPSDVTADELVKAPLVPGGIYVGETANFAPMLKAYVSKLDGLAVVRVRPAPDAGSSIAPLEPEEVEIIEVPAPKGVPGDEESGETGLEETLRAIRDAVDDAKVAVRNKPPVIFFEGFEFIVDRYGFVFSKKFADQLKKIAGTEGCYLFVAVDPEQLEPAQLEGLERDAVVFRGG